MNRRMLGKTYASACDCCREYPRSSRGKAAERRSNKRRERNMVKSGRYDI